MSDLRELYLEYLQLLEQKGSPEAALAAMSWLHPLTKARLEKYIRQQLSNALPGK